MARLDASDLARRLGEHADAVCSRYLDAGHRQGNYWQVGDVRNRPGRSMFVRLSETTKGAAGKWTDAATGEHGDLLDVIREACGFTDFADVVREARSFLSLPHPDPGSGRHTHGAQTRPGSTEAAKRLFAMSRPIRGTIVETYLRNRGITGLDETENLRSHPRCYCRTQDHGPPAAWPAMIAAVTDLNSKITGAHRTWLAPDGSGKAPITIPRKAMGDLLGHAVRFGGHADVMAAGEGIESILSARQVLPGMAMVAALSAAHLAAIEFDDRLRRLYIVRDNDPAGYGAQLRLIERANAAGIEAIALSPVLKDFNDDLRHLGITAFRSNVRVQIDPLDAARFLSLAA